MKIFKKEYKSVYIVGIVFSFIFTIFYLIDFELSQSLFFSSLEKKWHDTKFYSAIDILRDLHIFPQLKEPDKRIIIVGIDDKTLESYGWPMPRRYYKPLIENLNKYGARVIGFDIMFFDPDKRDPENDKILSQTVRENKNVVLAVSVGDNANINLPMKVLLENTTNLASLSASTMIDSDGKIRKIYPFLTAMNFEGEEKVYYYKDVCPGCGDISEIGLPLLGTYLYSFYSGISLKDLYQKWHSEWGDKSFLINFRKTREKSLTVFYDYISVKDVIEDTLSDEEKNKLKGAIILVGSISQGTFDHFPTPASEHTPGIEVHALAIDNLLNNDYLLKTKFYIFFPIFLFYIWLPVLLIKNNVLKLTLYDFAFLVIPLFLSVSLIKYRYDFYFITYLIPNLISYTYVVAYKSIVEDKQKRWIKNTFSQYLSPEVVDILVSDPSKLKLGGEKKDMTIFFMDIAGFTSISEKLSPEEVTNLLNIYLSELSDVILAYKGVIDKYIGDCIMAFWNAPVDLKNHRTYAVKSAIKCLDKVRELNSRNSGTSGINVRIGINSGDAVVGNMGSNKRFSYTVLGDTVNLASRLEGANKYFHTNVMVSDDVYKEAKEEIVFKYIGDILVVGKAQSVKVWEPYKEIKDMNDEDKEFIKNFENGIKYFYDGDYPKSADFFKSALRLKEDALSRFYFELSQEFLKKGNDGFNGIFNIRSK
ncbi:MAG: adenylate/guanylate cyclase domain-containing protein [Elusimicrobiota bacterium]